MMSLTQPAASSTEREADEHRLHRLGHPDQPQGQRRRDAEGALAADERAEQVVAGVLGRGAAEVDDARRPGSTTSAPVTWLTVNPYFRQCAPPAFSATLPPIEQTCWLLGSGA